MYSGVEYPVIDGYTVRISLRLLDQLQRAFPARTISRAVMDPGQLAENQRRAEHNKTDPDKLLPLIAIDTVLKDEVLLAGTPDFGNVADVVKAYAMIVNETAEVKKGEKERVDIDVLLECDTLEYEKIVNFVTEALTSSPKKTENVNPN
jgi:hypothetical protein